MACVVLGTGEFLPLARAQVAAQGLPGLPIVTVPHPIGGIPAGAAAAKAAPILPAGLAPDLMDIKQAVPDHRAGSSIREQRLRMTQTI